MVALPDRSARGAGSRRSARRTAGIVVFIGLTLFGGGTSSTAFHAAPLGQAQPDRAAAPSHRDLLSASHANRLTRPRQGQDSHGSYDHQPDDGTNGHRDVELDEPGNSSAHPESAATVDVDAPITDLLSAPRGLPRSRPVRIRIPAIGVSARVVPVALTAKHTVATPPPEKGHLAGWYRYGPSPGESGSAVVVGHVTNRQGPAVFYRLGELEPGDDVVVERADGRSVRFTVDGVQSFPKREFPTEQVYDSSPVPGLRLITCGGPSDGTSYANNVIVFASRSTRR